MRQPEVQQVDGWRSCCSPRLNFSSFCHWYCLCLRYCPSASVGFAFNAGSCFPNSPSPDTSSISGRCDAGGHGLGSGIAEGNRKAPDGARNLHRWPRRRAQLLNTLPVLTSSPAVSQSAPGCPAATFPLASGLARPRRSLPVLRWLQQHVLDIFRGRGTCWPPGRTPARVMALPVSLFSSSPVQWHSDLSCTISAGLAGRPGWLVLACNS